MRDILRKTAGTRSLHTQLDKEGHTLLMSRGYLVILCMGLRRKELRGRPPVRGSWVHFCSNSLNCGSEAFCCSSVQAVSWQLHQRMCGCRLGIWLSRMSPMFLTTAPEVRSRTRKALECVCVWVGGEGGGGCGGRGGRCVVSLRCVPIMTTGLVTFSAKMGN